MTAQDEKGKVRAWVEARSGVGANDPIFEKLVALTSPLMKKEHVVAIAATVLDGEPIEDGFTVWFGDYYFVFDELDRLVHGPNIAISGDIKIVCRQDLARD